MTHHPLTDGEIAEALRLGEAATARPWTTNVDTLVSRNVNIWSPDGICVGIAWHYRQSFENAAYIVWYCNNGPRAVAEVLRLRAALKPFARFLSFIEAVHECANEAPPDDNDCVASMMAGGGSDYLWIKDLRAAREALAGIPKS